MSTLAYAVRDSATMLRRDFRHALRYPMMTVTVVALPLFYLLLFVGVFGNALRAGLGAATPAGKYTSTERTTIDQPMAQKTPAP